MKQASPLPLPDWPAELRAQGRSMTWLAQATGVTRTYLAAIATGRKRASTALEDRIEAALAGSPERLEAIRDYAQQRAVLLQMERQATELLAMVRGLLGEPR